MKGDNDDDYEIMMRRGIEALPHWDKKKMLKLMITKLKIIMMRNHWKSKRKIVTEY